ncbi:MAG TPA: hypothetical protein VGF23_21960 [Gaiellaceae bacterium]|jgi:hypothetical protein
MPKLTPEELNAARRRSGRLGGRPRKPTIEEARQAALDKLVPKALKVLEAHLGGDGNDVNPAAWRAALRVFEHQFGRAPEQPDEGGVFAESADEIAGMSWVQLRLMAARLVGELPDMTEPDKLPIMAVNTGSKLTGSSSS